MASYVWIDLEDGNGYDQLLDVLEQEFNPKAIAASLRSQVTDAAKAVLVERGYVDKDYRSTFYNFYAKKGRHYRSDCVRLHFFNGAVRYDEARTDIVSGDGRLQDHYFGYIVLRPTIVATLGRSVLSPDIRLGATGRAIQSVHYVNLLGHRLPVWGFPSMAQHVDIAVCAHVSCWAILRYYSETFAHHREYLVHDITKLAAPFDPGGLVPSLGFNVSGAERVFQAAGCFPVLVGKQKSASEDAFFSQLLAYLESGFPLFVAMPGEKHAVVIVGYSWRQSATPPSPSSSHVWPQVETLLAVDDNLLPYSTVPLDSPTTAAGSPSYTAKSFEAFIVALPDKIYYPADAVEGFSKRVEGWLAGMRAPDAEPLQLRPLLHHHRLQASRVRPGEPYPSGRYPPRPDNAPGDSSVRMGRRVLQRGAVEAPDSSPPGPSSTRQRAHKIVFRYGCCMTSKWRMFSIAPQPRGRSTQFSSIARASAPCRASSSICVRSWNHRHPQVRAQAPHRREETHEPRSQGLSAEVHPGTGRRVLARQAPPGDGEGRPGNRREHPGAGGTCPPNCASPPPRAPSRRRIRRTRNSTTGA